MNIDALTAYLALSSGSYSGILRDMYAVHNLGLNPDLHTKLLANRFVGVTEELTGTPPLSFTSKGKPLTAWSITRNMVQNGTLTPDTPQEVKAVGDRTANLFDKDKQAGIIYVTETVTRYGVEIPVSAGTYSIVGGTNKLFVKKKHGTTYGTATYTSVQRTITLPQNGYILIYAEKIKDYTVSNVMLNSGSTALPYEPYGYKIPVVTRGKNLFDKTAVRYEVAIGNVLVDYPGSAIFIIPAIKGIKNYTLKIKSDVDINVIRLAFYDKPIPVPGEKVNNTKETLNSKNPIVTSSNVNNLPYIVAQISGAFVDSYGLDTVQLEIGDTATPYEPYHEPITTPIYLPTPLYSGEVLRSDGTITRSDGTTETFTAPQIPTLNGTTVIDVDTAVKPEIMTIKYRR